MKNEVASFASWIAWYKTIGFDTIIAYDDGSLDGTEALIRNAAEIFDVRLHKTTHIEFEPFELRQCRTYGEAIRLYETEFDWLAFLDADEYLFIPNNDDIGSFLAQEKFLEAGAIAVNWCHYGSNGRFLKPDTPLVEAYTRHAMPGGSDSENVFAGMKSIVRPNHVIPVWDNPHMVTLASGKYLTAAGKEPEYLHNGALIPIDFSYAKIMHFRVRSLEDYIERIRRRPDLNIKSDDYNKSWFKEYDRNDVEDLEPLSHLPQLYRHLIEIEDRIFLSASRAVRHGATPRNEVVQTVDPVVTVTATLRTHWGTRLVVDDNSGFIIHATDEVAEQRGLRPLIGEYLEISNGADLFLFARGHAGPLRLKGETRISDLLLYRIRQSSLSPWFFQMNPKTSLYMTAVAPMDGIGDIEADRRDPDTWEMFRLDRVHDIAPFPDVRELIEFRRRGLATKDDFVRFVESAPYDAHPSVIKAAIASLTSKGKAELRKEVGAPFPSWL